MEDKVEVTLTTDYLNVKVSGVRNNFKQVIDGSIRISKLASEYNQNKILADYTNVKFNLNLSEAFNLIRLYETQLQEFKKFKLAAVVNDMSSEIAGFYESIGSKRGFSIKVFTEIDKAKNWLKSANTLSIK